MSLWVGVGSGLGGIGLSLLGESVGLFSESVESGARL